MSVDRLIESIRRKKNPTVLGLDPQPEHVPPEMMRKAIEEQGETLAALASAYESFNRIMINALSDLVPAVKLQSACYEMLGAEGIRVFQSTIAMAREQGLYVIADAKRGDIGSTSSAYSAAFLGRVAVGSKTLTVFDADALTVNPYLGSDNLAPFIKDCKEYDKMLFILCKTSNPSSSEVQELVVGDRPLYRVIAEQVSRAGQNLRGDSGYLQLGIVAGATQPGAMKTLRARHPELFFLVPGYGAQGGKAEDIAYAFGKYGLGAIVNNSRGITCAYQKTGGDPADAARQAAVAMRDDLCSYITIV